MSLVPPPPMTLPPLTRTDFVQYQGASYDLNPVHHDEPFARAAGYPAPLAVGMFTAGVATSWATAWLGPNNVRRTRIRWMKPAFPGTVLTISGEVEQHRRAEDGALVDVRVDAVDQDGDLALQVWMTFVTEGG